MVFYPVTIEPYDDNGQAHFIAKFPDVPDANRIGVGRDDALNLAIDQLQYTLVDKFLAGQPMPVQSPAEPGQAVIAAPFHWRLP